MPRGFCVWGDFCFTVWRASCSPSLPSLSISVHKTARNFSNGVRTRGDPQLWFLRVGLVTSEVTGETETCISLDKCLSHVLCTDSTIDTHHPIHCGVILQCQRYTEISPGSIGDRKGEKEILSLADMVLRCSSRWAAVVVIVNYF